MTALRSIAMAFALFTRIPMPRLDWGGRNMRFLLAAFPLVGAIIGACLGGWWVACDHLGLGTLMRAGGLVLIPHVITGGIHLDGFADVTDALASHTEPERKRAIMKDPHVGAFAVIGVSCYLVAHLALASELAPWQLPFLVALPVLSRCLAGLACLGFPAASASGMLATVRSSASAGPTRWLLVGTYCAASAGLFATNAPVGAVVTGLSLAVLALTRRLAVREFGGANGDVVGYLLQLLELVMLAGIVLAGKVV